MEFSFELTTENVTNIDVKYTTEIVDNNDDDYTVEQETARLIYVFSIPTFMILGTIGNILTFVVMRRGSLKKISTCFYMTMLALGDLGVLWMGGSWTFTNYYTRDQFNLDVYTGCKIAPFIYYFSLNFSSAILVIMSVEKWFALYFPLKARNVCTVKVARWVSLATAVIFGALNIIYFFVMKVVTDEDTNRQDCIWTEDLPKSFEQIYRVSMAFLYSSGSALIMIITSTAIIYKLIKARNSHSGENSTSNKALSKSAKQSTVMLVTVSICFIALTSPITIAYSVLGIPPPLILAAFTALNWINHSINCFLYCIFGSKFREELFKLFIKNKVGDVSTATGHSGTNPPVNHNQQPVSTINTAQTTA